MRSFLHASGRQWRKRLGNIKPKNPRSQRTLRGINTVEQDWDFIWVGARSQHSLMGNTALSQEDFSYMHNEMIRWLQLQDALGTDTGWGRRCRDRRELHPCEKFLKCQKVVFKKCRTLSAVWHADTVCECPVAVIYAGLSRTQKMRKCGFLKVHVSNNDRTEGHEVRVHVKTGSVVSLQPFSRSRAAMQTPNRKSRRCGAQGWVHEWLCLPLRTSFHSSPKLYKLPVTERSWDLYDEWKRYSYFLGSLSVAQFRIRDKVNVVASLSV